MAILLRVLVMLLYLRLTSAADAVEYMTCCVYCRSEPQYWHALAGDFQLTHGADITKMQSPAAFLVDDEETAHYTNDGREYKLHYAGAPLKIRYTDLDDLDQLDALLKGQFMQVDLAFPKYIGGVMIQGGFYEEQLQGLFDYTDSFVTDFVVSYSNDSLTHYFYRNLADNIISFKGGARPEDRQIVQFDEGIVARYIRVHPIRATNEKGVVTDRVNNRLTVITCSTELCVTPQINCLISEWGTWSTCTCSSLGCLRVKERSIRRVQACGGQKCGALTLTESCTSPEPLWKTVVQYLGIALVVLVLALVIGFVIYKKTHKDRVEVIVVKEKDDEEFIPRRNFVHPRPAAPSQSTPHFQPNRPPPFGAPGGSKPSQPHPMHRAPVQPMGPVTN